MKPETIENCPCISPCPIDAVFKHVGGKWKIKIICTLYYNETLHYSDIKRMVKGISPTMLAGSLRELEESGLITRSVLDTMPVRTEYALSDAGRSLAPILKELREWMVAYTPQIYTELELKD